MVDEVPESSSLRGPVIHGIKDNVIASIVFPSSTNQDLPYSIASRKVEGRTFAIKMTGQYLEMQAMSSLMRKHLEISSISPFAPEQWGRLCWKEERVPGDASTAMLVFFPQVFLCG